MKDALKGILFVALFAIPFIPLLVTDSLFFPFITGKNFTFRILVEVAFAAWVLLALYDAAYRPRFSWVAAALVGLLGVMFVANLFGEYPHKSFWSNYERMEGYVTLVHVFLLVITLGSTLQTKQAWQWFFNTTLLAASIVALYAFGQLSGNYVINQGGGRVDGTLGNAAYMAVYMLFHTFIALWMLIKAKSKYAKYGYGALALVFIFLLIQTATRGTTLGLVAGLLVAGSYIALFSGPQAKQIRKYAAGAVVAVIVIIGGFIAAKDRPIIADNPILGRIANISFDEASTRFQIWSMAFEGVKERPILGWGQGNFNYVFNQYYSPELYAQEPWFDRVHNIVMDWLIAGGVVGFAAYVSIFLAALYYLIYRPRLKGDETFTVVEQGLLVGLLAAYVVHNLVVFDNVVSYIFFAVILALIHSRTSTVMPRVQAYRLPERVVSNVAVPVVVVVAAGAVYLVNVPGIQAAGDIIDGFTAKTPQAMLTEFESAMARGSFADQEIREQFSQRALQALSNPDLSDADREAISARTEAELLKQEEEKPGDARVYVFVSSYYRSVRDFEKAREQLALARQYSPKKQQIIFEQGFTELQAGDREAAEAFFKEAFELEPEYLQARTYYAAALLFNGKVDEAEALLETEKQLQFFAKNDIAVNAARQAKDYPLLVKVAKIRIDNKPDDLQQRVGLAAVYYEMGDNEEAIATLEEAIADFPDFKAKGEGYIDDIKNGRTPGSSEATVQVGNSENVKATVKSVQ